MLSPREIATFSSRHVVTIDSPLSFPLNSPSLAGPIIVCTGADWDYRNTMPYAASPTASCLRIFSSDTLQPPHTKCPFVVPVPCREGRLIEIRETVAADSGGRFLCAISGVSRKGTLGRTSTSRGTFRGRTPLRPARQTETEQTRTFPIAQIHEISSSGSRVLVDFRETQKVVGPSHYAGGLEFIEKFGLLAVGLSGIPHAYLWRFDLATGVSERVSALPRAPLWTYRMLSVPEWGAENLFLAGYPHTPNRYDVARSPAVLLENRSRDQGASWAVNALAADVEKQALFVTGCAREVTVWDGRTMEKEAQFDLPTMAWSARFVAASNQLLVGANVGTILAYDSRMLSEKLGSMSLESEGPVNDMDLLDDRRVVGFIHGMQIGIWDFFSFKRLAHTNRFSDARPVASVSGIRVMRGSESEELTRALLERVAFMDEFECFSVQLECGDLLRCWVSLLTPSGD